MIIDMASLSPNQVYFSLIQTVIPRPIAWVLSDNGDGSHNLAPFSYFNAVASDPPLIMLSIGSRPDGSPKDTRENIEQRKHFVVHIAHPEMLESLNETSRSLPSGQSELERISVDLTDFGGFSLPRISQCRVALACELYSSQRLGSDQLLILGQVQKIYVADEACEKDAKGRSRIRADLINPIGRLGTDEYCTMGEVISLRRPA
jgi:flavin reductase (DIM6/NTAB) family NADH-FMN oxidoreductase RutF